MTTINKDIINNLKVNIDIADLIGRFLNLKKQGNTLKANCPFHNEKTPSFTVSPNNGIFKCHGCGEFGDHITFLQKHENLSFVEAVHWLANEYNLPIPEKESQNLRQPHFDRRAANPDEKAGEYQVIYEDELTEDDLRIWFPKNIIKPKYKPNSPDTKNGLDGLYGVLEKLRWRRVKSYSRVKKNDDGSNTVTTISSKAEYPIYGREENWTHFEQKGTFIKIYQPLHHDKRYKFQYLGELPTNYVNGLSQANTAYEKLVQEENDRLVQAAKQSKNKKGEPEKKKKNPAEAVKLREIVICSGERDAATCLAMDYHPVWFNSESAKITPGILGRLFMIAKTVYNIPDIDETGLRQMHALSMNPEDEKYLAIKNVLLPEGLRKKYANGKPCKDLRDYLNYWTKKDFKKVLEDAMPYKFWQYQVTEGRYNTSEKYALDNEIVFFFLEQNGFHNFQLTPEGHDTPEMCFVRIQDNTVTKVNASDIKNWVLNFLRERRFPRDLRNTVVRSNYFTASMLETLRPVKPDFITHSPTVQLMFFENKVWEISAEGIKEHKPGYIKKYVWSDKVIRQRVEVQKTPPFTVTWTKEKGFDIVVNDESSLFLKFLRNTSAIHWRVTEKGVKMADGTVRKEKTEDEIHEEKQLLINKIFALGYLSHRQKFNHRPWFVYGMEHHVTGEGKSSGGTGKSAFFAAPKYYMHVFNTPGSRREEENAHRFGAVTEHVDLVYFDDMHEFFSWREIYQHTTTDFPVNPKGRPGFTIPFHLSPKLCGSGNFAVRDMEGSTSRRQIFVVFSDYYHSASPANGMDERTIFDDLGKQLFTDFNQADWNSFYNIIAECIKVYLWNPTGSRINPPMENVMYKNMRSHIGETFINWAETVFHPSMENTDCYISREALQEHYSQMLKRGNMGKYSLSPQAFKDKLEMYCNLVGFHFNPHEVMALHVKENTKGTPRIMMWFSELNGTKEMFYIQSDREDGPTPVTSTKKLDVTKAIDPEKKNAQEAATSLNGGKDDLPF